jgi:hypothetical protein
LDSSGSVAGPCEYVYEHLRSINYISGRFEGPSTFDGTFRCGSWLGIYASGGGASSLTRRRGPEVYLNSRSI